MTERPAPDALSWTPAGPPTLEGLRAFALAVARDLDPGSRYVAELLAVLDASSSVEDYLRRLADAEHADAFRRDGSGPSRGERGFSWVDARTWADMDPFEQTLSNLLTGETRMMWGGEGAPDWERLPDALAAAAPGPGPARVLSVPCSTGKEPYSLVIGALEAGREVELVGVDRQASYVARAASGRLVPHQRDWSHAAAARWLRRLDDGATAVSDELLRRCRFEQGDVLTGALPAGPFDLVSCRNLLGYFRGESLARAVRNVAARVRPGGLLLVDPFVTEAADMALARETLAGLGLARRWADRSYFDRPA